MKTGALAVFFGMIGAAWSGAQELKVVDPVRPAPSCVIQLRVTATVLDSTGSGVAGAELWYLDDLGGFIEPTSANRIGVSDADGHVSADLCYMSEVFYCAKPPTGRRRLRFMVLKDGWGVVRRDEYVLAERLLKEGLSIVGKPCTGKAAHLRIGEAGFSGYPMSMEVTLRRVQ